jgi:hypothetical protein
MTVAKSATEHPANQVHYALLAPQMLSDENDFREKTWARLD